MTTSLRRMSSGIIFISILSIAAGCTTAVAGTATQAPSSMERLAGATELRQALSFHRVVKPDPLTGDHPAGTQSLLDLQGFAELIEEAFITLKSVVAVDTGETLDQTWRLIDLRLTQDDQARCAEWARSHPGEEVAARMGDVVVATVEFQGSTARLKIWDEQGDGDKIVKALLG